MELAQNAIRIKTCGPDSAKTAHVSLSGPFLVVQPMVAIKQCLPWIGGYEKRLSLICIATVCMGAGEVYVKITKSFKNPPNKHRRGRLFHLREDLRESGRHARDVAASADTELTRRHGQTQANGSARTVGDGSTLS